MTDTTTFVLQDPFDGIAQAERRGFVVGVIVSAGVMAVFKSYRMVRQLERERLEEAINDQE